MDCMLHSACPTRYVQSAYRVLTLSYLRYSMSEPYMINHDSFLIVVNTVAVTTPWRPIIYPLARLDLHACMSLYQTVRLPIHIHLKIPNHMYVQ